VGDLLRDRRLVMCGCPPYLVLTGKGAATEIEKGGLPLGTQVPIWLRASMRF
jgi:hypothetical protein